MARITKGDLKKLMLPEIEMGASIRFGSDSYPYTIIWINKKGTQILIQPDKYELIEGNTYNLEHQVYKYTRNPTASSVKVSLRKDGNWRVVNGLIPVTIGYRRAYRDPSF